jgi:hypothetical protein
VSGGSGAISQFYAFKRQPIPRERICRFLGDEAFQNFASRLLRLAHFSLRIIAVAAMLAKRADANLIRSFGAALALLISPSIV